MPVLRGSEAERLCPGTPNGVVLLLPWDRAAELPDLRPSQLRPMLQQLAAGGEVLEVHTDQKAGSFRRRSSFSSS